MISWTFIQIYCLKNEHDQAHVKQEKVLKCDETKQAYRGGEHKIQMNPLHTQVPANGNMKNILKGTRQS